MNPEDVMREDIGPQFPGKDGMTDGVRADAK